MGRLRSGCLRYSMAQNTPSNRRLSKSGRAVGLKVVCAMAMFLGVSVGLGQPVPDTILLPDSLGPLRPGYHLAFGSSTENIYVASESSDILVVDGNTFQRIKRINTGPVGGALLVNKHNRLYCSYPQQGRIGVIDCATNNVIGLIDVGRHPKLLCYGSGDDKLYCGDSIDRTVTVIDCSADTVRKVISTEYGPTAMVYDPTTNKVYAATRDAVLAISCAADSIVANIGIRSSQGLCLNKRRQKLYVSGSKWSSPETIYVVSTWTDSVVAAMRCGVELLPRLACNEATDRLYAVNGNSGPGETILEFDCLGDTYIRPRYTPGYQGDAIACDTVHDRLFHLSAYNLLVLDCTTDSVVARIGVEDNFPSAILELDLARYRLMCAGWSSWFGEGILTVFDYKGATPFPMGAAPLCGWTHSMFHNAATGRLYSRWGRVLGGLGVIDEGAGRVTSQVFLSQSDGFNQLAYSRTSNKFYLSATRDPLGNKSGLGVLDGRTDSLLAVIEIGGWDLSPFPCWCPEGNKVYCFGCTGLRYYIAVVDCSTDSVVRTLDVYDRARGFEYLGGGRMLCDLSPSLALIDCRTDSVLFDSAVGDIYAVAHSGDGEKVYIVLNGRLEVRSSSSLSLLTTIGWPYFDPSYRGTFVAYTDTTQKLYWFVTDDSVLAIDTHSDSVVARMATGVRHDDACLDHTGRYLFITSRLDSCLIVCDTRSDSLLAGYPLLSFPPLRIVSNPDLGCVYVACQDVILAYPDLPPSVSEQPAASGLPKLPLQTVVRWVLFLAERASSSSSTSCLMDAAGRKVLDLRPGANDVSRLAPGVYFIRERPQATSFKPQAVRKIVITR